MDDQESGVEREKNDGSKSAYTERRGTELPKDMINNPYLGKWMLWKDVVKLFPDRWIFLMDPVFDEKKQFIGGSLKVVCREPEFKLVESIMTGENEWYITRTTELPGNILWVD